MRVARLRYRVSDKTWSPYWPDSNGRFHEYDGLPPSTEVASLLTGIDTDPAAIFWG